MRIGLPGYDGYLDAELVIPGPCADGRPGLRPSAARAGWASCAFCNSLDGRRNCLRPEERSTGLTPHSAANDASLSSAPGANVLIAAAKAVGGPFAHCPALLSEAARLLAHSLNEVFLLATLALAVRVDDLRGVRRR